MIDLVVYLCYILPMKAQKSFALKLLEFHGGQCSGLYAVGSCMLSDSKRGAKYEPKNHRGHAESEEEDTCGAVKNAIFELRGLRKHANFPECVKASDEKMAEKLAARLEKLIK